MHSKAITAEKANKTEPNVKKNFETGEQESQTDIAINIRGK